MTAKTIIAAAALALTASAAFAEAPYPVEKPFVSTTSRAAVKADLAKAQAQGLVNQGDAAYPVVKFVPARDKVQTAGAQTSLYSGA